MRGGAIVSGLVLAALLAMGQAPAANLPFLSTGGAEREPEPAERPEPAALSPDWHRYLDAEGEVLEQRVAAVMARLDELLAAMPRHRVVRAEPLVARIRSNLEALIRARAQAAEEPPPPAVLDARYTIPALLDIVRRLATERAELQAERVDVAALERTARQEQAHVDTLMAGYLTLGADKPARLRRGLEIMAGGTAVALAEERLRLSVASLRAHEGRVQQLAGELDAAREHLVVTRADVERVDESLRDVRARLRVLRERAAEERSKALGVLTEESGDRTTALFRQQQVVQASVNEAIAKVEEIRLLAERQLAALMVDDGEPDLSMMREDTSDWRGQLQEIRRQAGAWTHDSSREQIRASEAMAGAGEADQAPSLFDLSSLINQDRLDLAQQTLVSLESLEIALGQAVIVVDLVERELASREGALHYWMTQARLAADEAWALTHGFLTRSLFKLGDTPVTLMGLVRIALILFVAWLASYWLRRILRRLGERHDGVNQAALYTVGRLSHYVIITTGFVIGLASIGIDFTNFALLASAMAIGMGFGLQSIVSNFVSGLILLFERSLKVGDFVELASGIEGEVREINVRSTRINTNDNVDIVVPNSEFINTKVINWTLQENYRRIHVPFRVAFGTDIDRVTEAALEAAERVPHTLRSRRPGVWVVDFAENSLEFELVVWVTPEAVKRPGAVMAAYKKEIAIALYRHDIEVPVPQRDLRLRSGFERLGVQAEGPAEAAPDIQPVPASRR